jgi:hypothetical protein
MTYSRTRGYFLPRLGNAIIIIILAVSTHDNIYYYGSRCH